MRRAEEIKVGKKRLKREKLRVEKERVFSFKWSTQKEEQKKNYELIFPCDSSNKL